VDLPDEHAHRGLSDIRGMIESSGLSPWVKQMSVEAFRRLAEAEARIHEKTVDQVHFHEVGAVDSIIDIVGSMIALESFLPADIVASPVNVGHGTVRCQHGIYPVPAPAVQELLKDIPTLLYALAIVRRRMPDLDFKFINAGEGNMRGEWEKLRDDLGLGGLVYFAGFVSDIPCLLAQGDLFVLSTMSEGIAGSIIEAIASGLPVVATGIDGIPEIIQHEKNGLLSKPADPDSMAECIIRMLTQPEERQRMIDESKHIFDHDFTVDSMTAGNLNVYQSLLNK